MPQKSAKINSNQKKELAEKVKEIKQRQQNWLSQRSSAVEKTKPTHSSSNAVSSPQPKSSRKHKAENVDPFTPTPHKNSTEKTLPCRQTYSVTNKEPGFSAWLSHQRDSGGDTPDGAASITSSTADLPKNEQLLLGGADLDTYRSNSGASSVSDATLPPAQFDALADQIIHRVKKELHLEEKPPRGHRAELDTGQSSAGAAEVTHHAELERRGADSSTKTLESHYCPGCSQLMVPPRHDAMLIIPCGHSLCKSCIVNMTTCVTCRSDIDSSTCNIMLQQIIMEYKKSGSQVVKSRADSSRRSKNTYSPSTYKDDTDYREEYSNLLIRCEVFEAELENLKESMTRLDNEKKGEMTQIDNIQMEEDRVSKQIEELHHKLGALRNHREEYENKIKDIESRKSEQNNKIRMVMKSLRQLQKEATRVKRLAEENNR